MVKRFSTIFLPVLLIGFIFVGCSKYFNPDFLNAVKFNNNFVEVINPLMDSASEVQDLYLSVIPAEVTKETKIDISTLKARETELAGQREKANELKSLKSQNADQETKVLTAYELYLSSLDKYLKQMETVILFYEAKEFSYSPEEIKTMDESLKAAFKAYGEEHDKLVDLLASFK